jgi:hypothetical protein
VVEGASFAGLRVFGVVLLWTKRGDVCGKRGGEAGGFVVAERGTGFWDLFFVTRRQGELLQVFPARNDRQRQIRRQTMANTGVLHCVQDDDSELGTEFQDDHGSWGRV